MTSAFSKIYLLLLSLTAIALILLIAATAEAKELKLTTRQIVVEATAQNEASEASEPGAASTDLTEESETQPSVTPETEDAASEPSEPDAVAESDEPTITDRETLARAYLYALYLRAAQRSAGYSYGHSYSSGYSYSGGYDHCDH